MAEGNIKHKEKPDPNTEDGRPTDLLEYSNDVKAGYIPEGFETVEAFLTEMRESYQQDLDYDDSNRKEAIDDKKFAAGQQWDPQVLEVRKGLPCLTINSVPQFTAQLVGDWRQNRNAIKVVPSEDGDVDIASIRGDLVRSIEMKSRADRVYDTAFESMIQSGEGAFRVAVEYAKDDVFDQELYLRPIDDAQSVVWDRMSIDPTGRDAQHCFVDDLIPIKEFKRKWGDTEDSKLGDRTTQLLTSQGWIEQKAYRVTEYWRMIERDRLIALFENGSVHVLEAETFDEILEKNGKPIKTRVSPCLYAQMHLVTGFKILSGPHEYKLNRLPIIRMTGRVVNVAGERIRYGLVRFMKDPVRLRNFWRSVAAEQLGYAPKAQWIAPESAVEGREEAFRKAHLSRDPLLVYNDDATAPPQRVEPPQMQMALLNEAQVNTQDMKDVTGIHDASLGIKSNETSGKAIMARQREGDVASITFYDNGNASILEAGDVINQLIPQIYDATRIIRTVGEDEEIKMQKINDPSDPRSPNLATGNYDVALTSGTSYTTRRVEAAEAMMNAVQVWPNLIQVAGDIIAKAQDWPGAEKLAERLQKTIPQNLLSEEEKAAGGGAQTPPIDPQMVQQVQMEMQTLQQENAQLKSDKQAAIMKLEIDAYNAETQRIRALSDNQVDGNQLELQGIQQILEHSGSIADKVLDYQKHSDILDAQKQQQQTQQAAPQSNQNQ